MASARVAEGASLSKLFLLTAALSWAMVVGAGGSKYYATDTWGRRLKLAGLGALVGVLAFWLDGWNVPHAPTEADPRSVVAQSRLDEDPRLRTMWAGYAFAKYAFPGGKALFSIILGAIMIPTTALAIPTYLLFARADLTDTAWAIILPSLVSPFGVYLMRVYAADAVDTSLIEAARVDGVGEIRIFFQVALRLLVPGSVTVLLFGLVATWNNYFLPLIMLNTPEKFPLPVGLAQWQSTASAGSGAQAMFSTVITGSLVSIIPLVLAFLFLQRYWQSGLSTGGVKA